MLSERWTPLISSLLLMQHRISSLFLWKWIKCQIYTVPHKMPSLLHCSYMLHYTHLLTLNIQAQETYKASDLKNKVYKHSHSSKKGKCANRWHRRQCPWRKWPSLLSKLPSLRNAWAFSKQISNLSASLIEGQRAFLFRVKKTADISLPMTAVFDLFDSIKAVQSDKL